MMDNNADVVTDEFLAGRRHALDRQFSILLSGEYASYHGISYLEYHAARFDFVIDVCKAAVPDCEARVLDIGKSALTEKLTLYYKNVWALGLNETEEQTFSEVGHLSALHGRSAIMGHVDYDLNTAKSCQPIPTILQFDLIVFAEVIEHLTAAPEMVLAALRQILAPNGKIVIQTPNSAALHKRILMLLGRNPFERIRINYKTPGHYREYTKSELMEIAVMSGFKVLQHHYRDYFSRGRGLRGMAIGILKLCAAVMPSLARGQTIILQPLQNSPR